MTRFPEITTRRLLLRKIQDSDLNALITYCNNPKISEQIINIPHPYGEADALNRMKFINDGFESKQRYVFAITLQDNNELIGEIGLHLDASNDSAQFGYWIAEPFWGQGIASEALGAILQFGFETLKLNKIFATHYPENPASGKVMINNGLIKEAELKDHYKINVVFRDVIQYRLTRSEYLAQR